jgi:hypothetical protein
VSLRDDQSNPSEQGAAVRNLIMLFLMLCGSAAMGAPPPVVTTDVPSLSGGDMSPDMIDVTTMPSLGAPPSSYDLGEKAVDPATDHSDFADHEGLPLNNAGGPGIDAVGPLQCATPTGPIPPQGWTLTYAANVVTCSPPYTTGYYSVCFGPNHYCFNQVQYSSYNNIPVGGTLRFCSVIGVPAGWSVTQTGLSSSCAGSGDDWVMQHTTCVAGDTNCYPPSANISASPQTVIVPYLHAMASTTVSWNTVNYSTPCVWSRNNNGPAQVWACDGAGAHSRVWTYVPSNGTSTLWISSSGTTSPSPNVGQVVVTGIAGTAPTISASPQVVQIPAGSSTGSTNITYNFTGSGYTSMCIWAKNSTDSTTRLWTCTPIASRTIVWIYVPRGGTSTIWMTPDQSSSTPPMAQVVVTGQ